LDDQLAYHDTFHLACRKDERSRSTLALQRCLQETLTSN
jgi:hypothetical protein